MNNERTINVSEKRVTFFVSWETGSEPNARKYSREFLSIEAVAKFICKYPKRAYVRIYESEKRCIAACEEHPELIGVESI